MKGLSSLLVAVTAVCLNMKDVRNAECVVACKREGAHHGYYVEKGDFCACVNYYSYRKVTRKDDVRQRLEGSVAEPTVVIVTEKPTESVWGE